MYHLSSFNAALQSNGKATLVICALLGSSGNSLWVQALASSDSQGNPQNVCQTKKSLQDKILISQSSSGKSSQVSQALSPAVLAPATSNNLTPALLTGPQSEKDNLVSESQQYALLPKNNKLRHAPKEPELYQLDSRPLGDRKPLLLVHGLRGEYRPSFRWDQVIARLQKHPDFDRTFKVYFLRYNSTESIANTVPKSRKAILSLREACQDRPITVMALSLGGSLIQNAMAEPTINKSIQTVISFGVPFHGSPLFCSDWYQYSLYKNRSWPYTRIDHSVAYKLYFARNAHLLEDLKWDNADKAIPNIGHFRSRLPYGPKGDLTIATMSNTNLLNTINTSNIDKTKFITYAGYLTNPYLFAKNRRRIENTVMAPYTFMTMKVPAHLMREHPVLKMLNRDITRVIPAEPVAKQADSPFIYGLNDGITPVNSAIFLSSDVLAQYPLAKESDLKNLADKIDVRFARVFRNIDHLTFMDGHRPWFCSKTIKDELHPNQQAMNMLDWIVTDLMRSTSSHLAEDTEKPEEKPKL